MKLEAKGRKSKRLQNNGKKIRHKQNQKVIIRYSCIFLFRPKIEIYETWSLTIYSLFCSLCGRSRVRQHMIPSSHYEILFISKKKEPLNPLSSVVLTVSFRSDHIQIMRNKKRNRTTRRKARTKTQRNLKNDQR